MRTCGSHYCFCKVCAFICLIIAKTSIFILTLICLPAILLLLVVLWTYRTFARICASFDNNLGSILAPSSALLAGDEIYKQPLTCNVAQFQFEGHCDENGMALFVQDNWLSATSSDGKFKYPELRQCVVQYMSLYFWKNDPSFDVRNHVKLYGIEGLERVGSRRKLDDIWNELSMKPFDAGRSPWEVVVVPEFRENAHWGEERPKWIMIFRWHHCLADGFSILNLMSSVASFDPGKVAKASDLSTNSFFSSFTAALGLVFSAPFVILELLCLQKDKNAWHLSEKKLTRYWHVGVGRNISIQTIQDIKLGLNVSFSAVLLATVAGTLRQFMVAQEGEERKLPEFITCGVPLPIQKHPQKLRNHWAVGTVCLPIREENPFKRLQAIERYLKELKESNKPNVAYKLAKLLGSLPACITKAIAKNNVTTAICSIMPGPRESLKNFEGRKVLDAGYINGLGPGRNGFSFSVFSYSGYVKFAVTVDSAFSPDDTLAARLMQGIEDELNYLKQSSIKMVTIHI